MPDIENVTPVNTQKPVETPEDKPAVATPETKPAASPPPSNKERAAEAEAKEAEEKAAAEAKAAEEAEATGEEEAEDKALDTSVWGDAGDDVANSVLTELQNSGVTPDEAKALLWDAVEKGDPSKVDRDALVEKVGKARATLIMAGIENVTSKNNAKIEEVTAIAHKAAGDKESWTKATKWANAKMDASELDELRGMMDKGGRQAEFAASEIVSRYNADPNNTSLKAGSKQLNADGKAKPAGEPLSRRQYGEELDKAHRTGRLTPALQESLKARRALGAKQGI